jgi:hypothetical protein
MGSAGEIFGPTEALRAAPARLARACRSCPHRTQTSLQTAPFSAAGVHEGVRNVDGMAGANLSAAAEGAGGSRGANPQFAHINSGIRGGRRFRTPILDARCFSRR